MKDFGDALINVLDLLVQIANETKDQKFIIKTKDSILKTKKMYMKYLVFSKCLVWWIIATVALLSMIIGHDIYVNNFGWALWNCFLVSINMFIGNSVEKDVKRNKEKLDRILEIEKSLIKIEEEEQCQNKKSEG